MANIEKKAHEHDDSARLAWFLDAKVGVFIHWGAYSVAGVEASWPIMSPGLVEAAFGNQKRISEAEYVALAESFNPSGFDADEWVRIAADTGARYIVITSKHHDGYCMFDAPGTDYKITNSEFGRDVCAELAAACDRAGIRLGFYYSPPDMHHPGYRDTSKPAVRNWTGQPKRSEWKRYLDYMESHIRKLLTDYGDVAILWFDALSTYDKYDPPRFQRIIRELSPNTLVNDRLGPTYDYIVAEQFYNVRGFPTRTNAPPAVYSTGDDVMSSINKILKIPIVRHAALRKIRESYRHGELSKNIPREPHPSLERFQPWETSMTMNQSWGYCPTDTEWKSESEIIEAMRIVNSHGGNLLLNVGPTPEGTFPEEAISRLRSVGLWIRENGYVESLLGTEA